MMWDPNTWTLDADHEFRIYGDDNASIWAIVDQQDYVFLLNWLWSPKWSKRGKKVYLRRVTSNGPRGNRVQTTVWLHIAIMERTGLAKPSPLHTLVDHRNGNGLDCRRANLRWATPAMNRKNINGQYGYELIEDEQWGQLQQAGKSVGQKPFANTLNSKQCASAVV